jgi:hypothetical protein
MFIDFKHGEENTDDFDVDSATPFRYLVKNIAADGQLPVGTATVEALDKLGAAMVDTESSGNQEPKPDQTSTIPTIYTYWAQFIDHELTARTDRDNAVSTIDVPAAKLTPVARDKVERELLNRRTPALELDCVYGDGLPGMHGIKSRLSKSRNFELARQLRDGAKLRIGKNTVTTISPNGPVAGAVPPPLDDLHRDLPRIGELLDLGVVKDSDFTASLRAQPFFRKRAFIADPRNDENLIVAQFHVALLRFHNAVVDQLRFKEPRLDPPHHNDLFEDAQRIVRWTFQWLVVNDFMAQVLKPETVEAVIKSGAKAYFRSAGDSKEPYMPLEFSVACYRFGHSMIREFYDYNRNFGRATKPDGTEDETVTQGFIAPHGTLNQMFQFTGKHKDPFIAELDGGLKNHAQTLPHNWIIEWDRFDGTDPLTLRTTRKIDTHLEFPLGALLNESPGTANVLQILAKRNLRRGFHLSLPTGQALATALDIAPLSDAELESGNSPAVNDALKNLKGHTPLWFYTLKESELKEGGNRLGALGSRIVAETLIGVLLADPESYLVKQPTWNPGKPIVGAGGPLKLKDGRTIKKIGDLLEFAGVKPAK